jgi:transposase-like protein
MNIDTRMGQNPWCFVKNHVQINILKKTTYQLMDKLSTKHCPDCKSKNIVHLGKGPYDEKLYKCKECGRKWDKDNTRYCKACGDVVMYCSCYEGF